MNKLLKRIEKRQKKTLQKKYTLSIRLPLPPLAGKPHGTRKGKKGYTRQANKRNKRDAILFFRATK